MGDECTETPDALRLSLGERKKKKGPALPAEPTPTSWLDVRFGSCCGRVGRLGAVVVHSRLKSPGNGDGRAM